MSNVLAQLKPAMVWKFFEEITEQPRPSKNEGKIMEYIKQFALKRNLPCIQDEVGNILIRKSATPGYENLKSIVLQSHMDMVCEKNSDVEHDFDTQPIQVYIDNGWVKAKGTTLGADNGIGMAFQLAILDASDIAHGPIECLFTTDEETGLTGAAGLKSGFLQSNILINLDSEDEGEIFIGCAGGKDTSATFTYKKEKLVDNCKAYTIIVKGLKGGHSGDDINKGLGNSIKLLSRLLYHATKRFGLHLAHIEGGNLRNAIPREAQAIVAVPAVNSLAFEQMVKDYAITVANELKSTDSGVVIEAATATMPQLVIDKNTQESLINALYICPHGVMGMSADMPGLVETSTNLATIKMAENDTIIVGTSQRSSVESQKNEICEVVACLFLMANAKVKHGDGYPGWTPNINSEILSVSKDVYKSMFNKEPLVKAIHAGLECGLIGEKFSGIDMISIGPTMRGVHSPDERLNIESVDVFWRYLLELLKNLPKLKK